MAFARRNKYGRPAGATAFGRNVSPYPTLTGYENLSSVLTIDGTDHTADYQLWGSDGADPWIPKVGGTNFAETATGSSPGYGTTADYGDAVDYTTGNKYHSAANYLVTTNDIVLEMIYRHTDTNSIGPWSHYFKGANQGWFFQTTTGGALLLYCRSGSVVSYQTPNSTMTQGEDHHVMAIIDRDENSTNGLLFYVDGSYVGAANPFALSGIALCSASGATHVGHHPDGANATYQEPVSYVAMWQAATIFPGGASNKTEMDAIVAARWAAIQ